MSSEDKLFNVLNILPEDSVKEFYENHSTYNEGDAGIDLFLPEDVSILAGESVIIDLRIKCEMVETNIESGKERFVSYFIYPRSSISKTPLILANSVGVIDRGYRGSLKIALKYIPTLTDQIHHERTREINSFKLKRGERLVQICLPSLDPFSIEVVDSVSNTDRGEGGFGSTGK
jgi:dUTP pyrophosphatase